MMVMTVLMLKVMIIDSNIDHGDCNIDVDGGGDDVDYINADELIVMMVVMVILMMVMILRWQSLVHLEAFTAILHEL